ncbi:unnamed protein product [Mycena citricolor]|uniref:Uncharacterized protein n=1 Tax=Mycena citricolor TaxID=2018698 RepID=A0AAD2Q5F7_9AGAR|nr:unnamed protein product [Mycena citricolor]
MFSRLVISLAVALTYSSAAAAISCGVCAPTIVYAGVTRKLTLSREEGAGNIDVQCNYDSPPIPNFSPGCLYRNVDGVLIFTNAGNACPSVIPTVSKTTSRC